MFSKLGREKLTLYSNYDRVDFVEVRPLSEIVSPGKWGTFICFSSGASRMVYDGERDECEAFADTLMQREMGMRWKPNGA